MPQPCPQPAAVRRWEVLFVFLFTTLGAIVRLVDLEPDGLSHFDEGVYVLWALGEEFPGKEFFAPPLFPLLLRASFWLLGHGDVSALMVSGVIGTATIPLVWWVARRWHGPVAGACSLALAACSGYHVTFSRMALTDVSFAFTFVLAIWLASEMFLRLGNSGPACGKAKWPEQGRSVWLLAIGVGVAAGAAINIKYNGFLTVIVIFAPVAFTWMWGLSGAAMNWRRAAALWAVAATVALMLYLPWFRQVSSSVGYNQLLSHQRGYSSSLSAWPGNLFTFLAQHWCITGWLGRLGPGIGIAVATAISQPNRRFPDLMIVAVFAAACSLGILLGDAACWLIGSIASLIWLRTRSTNAAIQAAWVLGLLLITPLYPPYARLMLPLIVGGWIAAGGVAAGVLAELRANSSGKSVRGRLMAASAACVALAVVGVLAAVRVGWDSSHAIVFLGKRSGVPVLKAACEQVVRKLIPEREAVAAFVRPPVLAYVGSQRQVDLRGSLEFLDWVELTGSPQYLLIDQAMFLDNPQARQQLERARDRLQRCGRVRYRPSVAVLLDDHRRDCIWPDLWDRTTDYFEPTTEGEGLRFAQQDAWNIGTTPYQLFLYRIRTR